MWRDIALEDYYEGYWYERGWYKGGYCGDTVMMEGN